MASSRFMFSRASPSMVRTLAVRGTGLLCLLAVLGLGLSGCGSSSFVGQQYQDFTAYYNTFYNANQAYDAGMESLEARQEPVDRDAYLAIFQQPGSGDSESFEKAINKSASLLRKHPDSRWVDDALLLIGKSYYFQQNFVGAEQKFREVVELETDLEGQARFWLVRTYITARRYNEAAQVLSASLDEETDFGEWADRLYLARGQLSVRRGEWEAAEQALARGLEGEVPSDVAARAAFLLGQVRETLGQHGAAATAYNQVLDHSPRYELAYAARVSAIRMNGLYGDTDAALERLRDMEQDDKNLEKRPELTLLRGRLLQAQGKLDAAKETFRSVLYDRSASRGGRSRGRAGASSRASGEVRGRTHHALGVLYRDAYRDFEQAAAHFDTASTSLGARTVQAAVGDGNRQVPPASITDSEAQATRYGAIAEKAQAVARMDSLLRLGRMPQGEFETFVAELREKRAAELEAQARERARREESRRFRQAQPRTTQQSRSATSTSTAGGSDASFLFHEDPVRVQEGKRRFQRVWGDRPRVANWRRIDAISSGSAPDSAAQGGGPPAGAPATARQTSQAVQIDVSAVPRDSAAQAEMEASRAMARYELGNALFLRAELPDSAAVWYRRVVMEDSERPVARRALYALAEVHREQGKTATADSLYQELARRYPDSEFADRALQRLNQADAPALVAPDSSAHADSLYARGYQAWERGRFAEAFTTMARVVETYPSTPSAPRAALAATGLYRRLHAQDATRIPADAAAQLLRTLSPPDTSLAPPDRRASPPADSTSAAVDTSAAAVPRMAAADSAQAGGAAGEGALPDTTRAARPDTTEAAARREPPLSDAAAADSTGAGSPAPDSAAADDAIADTMRAAARPKVSGDSARTESARTNPVEADSVRAEPIAAVQDSTVGEDSTAAPGATVRGDSRGADAPPTGTAWVEAVLASITVRYADTPHAARAEQMLQALRQPVTASSAPDSAQTSAPAPSQAVPAADSVAAPHAPADTTARPPADTTQSLGGPGAQPRDAAAPDSTRVLPDTTTGLRDTTTARPEPPAPDSQAQDPAPIPPPAPPDTSESR